MMPFRRILVAVDFSEASDAAWHLASQLAGRDGTLVALNVVVRPAVPDVAYANIPAALEEQRRDNERRMARLVADGAGAPRVEHRVVIGDLAHSIAQVARETAADLVVVGNAVHPHEGLMRLLRGSVIETLVREVPAHVLVVRAPS